MRHIRVGELKNGFYGFVQGDDFVSERFNYSRLVRAKRYCGPLIYIVIANTSVSFVVFFDAPFFPYVSFCQGIVRQFLDLSPSQSPSPSFPQVSY